MGTERVTGIRNGAPNLFWAIVLTALAGGMGWGIRGQYGHETGAMIAGVLVGFTLVLLFLPQATSLQAARTVALITLGISFGGSMTYGQTLGLSHGTVFNPEGRARALWADAARRRARSG